MVNLFEYQHRGRYFAQVAEGVASLAMAELETLGARDIVPGFRGLHFSADRPVLYAINYRSRLVTRVLAPLITFHCIDREALYQAARRIDWPALLRLDQTFAVFANVSGNPQLTHSKFAALCLKDAVVDTFRLACGRRPDVARTDPDLVLNLHIEKEQATISLDTSGGSLHKRGYRRESVAAPMQETLAAAIIGLSDWQGQMPLVDPMCGSGTLLCEALMHICNIPAGYLRPGFGFRRLPDYDDGVWQRVKTQADAHIRPLPRGVIAGSDYDPDAVKAARINCRTLPGSDGIRLRQADWQTIETLENSVIVCNPPYGVRMAAPSTLADFYKSFGDFLKQRCKGSQAYL
ncbi:MAG: class I SAM-dependent RNA methyltransferase, partial [Desulfatitalea sp.]|nr:class I SAM-dependent RNA methyltransferase [Desulfatitalea sp.]